MHILLNYIILYKNTNQELNTTLVNVASVSYIIEIIFYILYINNNNNIIIFNQKYNNQLRLLKALWGNEPNKSFFQKILIFLKINCIICFLKYYNQKLYKIV